MRPPTPIDLQELSNVLLRTFPNRSDLERLARYALDVSLDVTGPPDAQAATIYKLVAWAQAQGRLEPLLLKALDYNPGNTALRAVVGGLLGTAPGDDRGGAESGLGGTGNEAFVAIDSDPLSTPAPGPTLPLAPLTRQQRQQLLQLLIATPTLDSQTGRDALVAALPPVFQKHLDRVADPVLDLNGIVRACEAWGGLDSGGSALQVVIERAQQLAPGTAQATALAALLAALRTPTTALAPVRLTGAQRGRLLAALTAVPAFTSSAGSSLLLADMPAVLVAGLLRGHDQASDLAGLVAAVETWGTLDDGTPAPVALIESALVYAEGTPAADLRALHQELTQPSLALGVADPPAPTEYTTSRPDSAPPLRLNPAEHAGLVEALCAAFPSQAALGRMVSLGLGEQLDTIAPLRGPKGTPPPALEASASALIDYMDKHDRLRDLVTAARQANPGNASLRAFVSGLDGPDLWGGSTASAY